MWVRRLLTVVGAEVEVQAVGVEVEVQPVGAEVEVAQARVLVEVEERVARQRAAGPATEVVPVTAAAERRLRLAVAGATHRRAGTRSVQAGAPRSRHLEAFTVPAMLPSISRQ